MTIDLQGKKDILKARAYKKFGDKVEPCSGLPSLDDCFLEVHLLNKLILNYNVGKNTYAESIAIDELIPI